MRDHHHHPHHPTPKLGNLTRRRLAQGYSFSDMLDDLPLGKDINTSSMPVNIRFDCFDRLYRAMIIKLIQLKNIPRQKRLLILLGIVSFGMLITIDRMTTRTESTSKWARMMYEQTNRTTSRKSGPALRGSSSEIQQPSVERPTNLHIAFVGDSVTRYMYLDLVYFLKFNRWVQDTDHPNILNAKQFPSWNSHYNFSTLALSPNEECDCFRLNPKNSSHIDKEETIENRYYADPKLNNYATFIEIFGGYEAHGHILPQEAYLQPRHAMDFERLQSDPFVWRHDWPGLIRNYLNEMKPKPDYLVFNEGLWIEHELGDEEVRQSIKDALDDTGIVGIYKTTTLPNINSGLAKRSAGVVFNRHDDAVCDLIGNCLDFSWTKDLGDEHYWDGVHFKPHVNRGMNMELLDLLQRLKQTKMPTPSPLKQSPNNAIQ